MRYPDDVLAEHGRPERPHKWRHYGYGEVACECGHEPSMAYAPCPIARQR